MKRVNIIVPPWDGAYPNGEEITPGQKAGIYGRYGGSGGGTVGLNVFPWHYKAALGIYPRVKAWAMSGTFSWVPLPEVFGTPVSVSGTLSANFEAYSYADGTTLTIEEQLALHGGWKGTITGSVTFTFEGGGTETVSVTTSVVKIWQGMSFAEGVDAINQEPILDKLDFNFSAETDPEGDHPGYSFGLGVDVVGNAGLNATLTVTLPATWEDSFDGSGETEGLVALSAGGGMPDGEEGSIALYGPLTGTFTMEPASGWGHDPDDGDGPIYDTTTLEIERPELTPLGAPA